jgi:hypothetical protein
MGISAMSANCKGPLSLPTYSFDEAMNAWNDNNDEPSGATHFLPAAPKAKASLSWCS